LLVGTLTFLIASIVEFRQTLSSFFEQIGRQYEDNLFVNDLFDFLDWKPVIVNAPDCIKLSEGKTPKIEFKNVSFAYPGTTKMSLENISFTLNPGEKLALVGQNGAGKTTLIKLLCRFYDPTEGEILVDGTNLKNIDINDWHRILGVLFQEYGQYNFMVKESIGMGRTDDPLSLERVHDAAESSESESFIKEWKSGYDQMLGKEFTDGVEPSVGQWQKLALARTFYRNPKIYVFDEPTASIDAEAKAKIFEKLESLPKDRSVIIISHRFSTVRQAQVIVVLKDGQIEEQGTHGELLEKNALYARLFKLQAKGYA
jgi:ATP-binding cassette subfamily B protein